MKTTKIAHPKTKRTTIQIKPSSKVHRFIVVGAVRGAPVHVKFLENLEIYAKHKKAEILVAPIDSGFSSTDTVLSSKLDMYAHVDDRRITSNLMIKSFGLRPQMIDPTTGLDRFIQADASALIASPKQRMRCCANSNVTLPKILQGTGVCTLPKYRDNRQGHIAVEDHVIGAIYVETNGELFNFRQLTANKESGAFYDLGLRVEGSVKKERADALVLGDLHTGSICPKVRKATYELIKEVQPRKIIIHDLFDGKSVNHHELNKKIKQSVDYAETNVEEEIEMCYKELKNLLKIAPKDAELVVVTSNHDLFLDRYLEEGKWMNNYRNQAYLMELALAMHQGKSPLKYGVEKCNGAKPLDRVVWLDRDQDYKVRGWQLGSHGDLGSNGARGSLKSTQKSTGRSITGHTHTPEILNETISVGTSTVLKMGYNKGPSSWMNTHGLLYPNAKAQLINIIEGKYKV